MIVLDDASHDDTFVHGQLWAQREDTPKTAGHPAHQEPRLRRQPEGRLPLAIEHGLDIVVLLHGDGQYAPEMLPEMVAPLERGECDAVFGSRMMDKGAARKGGMPLYKWVGNRILTRFENGMLGTKLTEFHSGYRAYSVAALRELPFEHNTDDFDFDTQIIIQLVHAGKRIVEIPIPTYYGDEICYVNGMKYAKDVVKDVVEYRLAAKGFGTAALGAQARRVRVQGRRRHLARDHAGDAGRACRRRGCSTSAAPAACSPSGSARAGTTSSASTTSRSPASATAPTSSSRPTSTSGSRPRSATATTWSSPATSSSTCRGRARRCRRCAGLLRPGGQVLLSVPNFGHWYPRLRVMFGLFGYDRRGILDDTHLRFFTRSHAAPDGPRHRLRRPRGAGHRPAARHHLRGRRPAAAQRCARSTARFVRLRPTLFGYQFVLRLIPHAEEAVIVEGR